MNSTLQNDVSVTSAKRRRELKIHDCWFGPCSKAFSTFMALLCFLTFTGLAEASTNAPSHHGVHPRGSMTDRRDEGTIGHRILGGNEAKRSGNYPARYSQVLEEYEGATVEDVTMTKCYTLGDDVISQTVGNTTTHLGYDGHGSTRTLTDGDGALATTFHFDAYGKSIALERGTEVEFNQVNQPECDLLYSGEQYDAPLQMQYLRARYYDQNVGSFDRLDPFKGRMSDPQSLHKYAYCHGDSVNGIDPSGRSPLGEVMMSTLIRLQSFAHFLSPTGSAFTFILRSMFSVMYGKAMVVYSTYYLSRTSDELLKLANVLNTLTFTNGKTNIRVNYSVLATKTMGFAQKLADLHYDNIKGTVKSAFLIHAGPLFYSLPKLGLALNAFLNAMDAIYSKFPAIIEEITGIKIGFDLKAFDFLIAFLTRSIDPVVDIQLLTISLKALQKGNIRVASRALSQMVSRWSGFIKHLSISYSSESAFAGLYIHQE